MRDDIIHPCRHQTHKLIDVTGFKYRSFHTGQIDSDIDDFLTDVQLGFYTEPDDPGNHSHVQVNNLLDKDYLRMYFKGVTVEGVDTSFIEEEEKAAEEAKKAEEEAEANSE